VALNSLQSRQRILTMGAKQRQSSGSQWGIGTASDRREGIEPDAMRTVTRNSPAANRPGREKYLIKMIEGSVGTARESDDKEPVRSAEKKEESDLIRWAGGSFGIGKRIRFKDPQEKG